MKGTAFVLMAMIVGSFASPRFPALFGKGRVQEVANERIVTGQIIEAIEDIAQQIRDAGLDPLNIDTTIAYELPVPVILSIDAIIDNLVFTGLSNIVVENMNFSILQTRLTFTIALPGLNLSIRNSAVNVLLFGKDYPGSLSGSFSISRIRISGDVRVNVGIISGITIRSLDLQLNPGVIQSNLNINALGNDLSARVNTLLGVTIPATLREFEREINELLVLVGWDLIESILDGMSFRV